MPDNRQSSLFPSFDAEAQNTRKNPKSKPGGKNAGCRDGSKKTSSQEIDLPPHDIAEKQGECVSQDAEQTSNQPAKKKPALEGQNKATAVLADRFSSYLKVSDVARRLDISVPTVWRWTKERPDFPRPKKFGVRVSRWLLADLIAFESGEVR